MTFPEEEDHAVLRIDDEEDREEEAGERSPLTREVGTYKSRSEQM